MEDSLAVVSCSIGVTHADRFLLYQPVVAGDVLPPAFLYGTATPDETLLETALRTARELSGLNVTISGLVLISKIQHTVNFTFMAESPDESVNTTDRGTTFWVSRQELQAMVDRDRKEERSFGSPAERVRAQRILKGVTHDLSVLFPTAP